MKILITAGYKMSGEKLGQLKELGCNAVVWPDEKEPVTEEHFDAEVLFSFRVFEHTDIRQFHSLKLIQLTSSGMDHVPMDWIKEKKNCFMQCSRYLQHPHGRVGAVKKHGNL